MTRSFLILSSLIIVPACLAQGMDPEKFKEVSQLPIQPKKTLEFTTDEGTWMSLDLSPDGRTIVFELLGDLYTMPASGGKATRIVGGIHYDGMPRFSPDGKRIVFVTDRTGAENLWLVNADGTMPKAVTKGRLTRFLSPSWSHDGKRILASKFSWTNQLYKLFEIDLAGGTGLEIGPAAPTSSRTGVIESADGRYLYYAHRTGPWQYESKFPQYQIRRWDRERGTETVITNAPGSGMRPMLSKDGKTLYFGTRHQTQTALKSRNLQTGEEKWVAYPIDRDDQESRASRDTIASYAFTPDGKSIITPLKGKIQNLDLGSGKPTPIPFTADVKVEVNESVHFKYPINEDPMVTAKIIRYPALSPDGKKIVFAALGKIWIQEPGGKARRLTDSSDMEYMPSWSPDGSKIVYATWSMEGGHIYSVGAAGGSPTRLTRDLAFYNNPTFTSDGNKIVFIYGSVTDGINSALDQHVHANTIDHSDHSTVMGNFGPERVLDLKWIPYYGGEATYIASSGFGSYLQPAKDPNRVFLMSGNRLWSIRTDGLERRDHLIISGDLFEGGANEIRISPDNRQAVADFGNRLFVFSIPQTGGQPLEVKPRGKEVSVPLKQINAEGGTYLNWTADGSAVTWSMGNKFYKQSLDSRSASSESLLAQLPRHTPSGSVLLQGATIITMRGDEVIKGGDVLIRDNRIVYVGPKATNVPAGTKVIDAKGKFISPGMVDVHSHWFGFAEARMPQSWGYLTNLAYGVTTNRDPQSATTDIYDYADMIATGNAIGPRVYSTGPGVFTGIGIDDLEGARNYIKRYKEAYDTHTIKQYRAGDRLVRQWIAMACEEYGITPTTEGSVDTKLGLTEIADGYSGHEHNFPIWPLYNDMAQYLARTNTYYTPTLVVTYGAPAGLGYWFENTDVANDPKLRRFVPYQVLDQMTRRRTDWYLPEEYGFQGAAAAAARVVNAGGKVCLGSHGELQGLGAHWELWSLASGGMTPHQALRCATLFGAEAIGLDDHIGSVESGKFADLVVYDKNPLSDIKNSTSIRYVIKNGEIFEAESMNQIWPVNKPLPKQVWQLPQPKVTLPN